MGNKIERENIRALARKIWDYYLMRQQLEKADCILQKPYMERRAYATARKVWSDKEIIVTSPPISFEEYPTSAISEDDLITIMVGDLQRIKLYAENGFQIPQEIPSEVWQAYKSLVAMGYAGHLQ